MSTAREHSAKELHEIALATALFNRVEEASPDVNDASGMTKTEMAQWFVDSELLSASEGDNILSVIDRSIHMSRNARGAGPKGRAHGRTTMMWRAVPGRGENGGLGFVHYVTGDLDVAQKWSTYHLKYLGTRIGTLKAGVNVALTVAPARTKVERATKADLDSIYEACAYMEKLIATALARMEDSSV